MRHWIFATRCVFTSATDIHSCPAIQHIWVAFYASWFHLFNFFQHAWMIYTSKGRALYPDVCGHKLINIVPFQEATQSSTSNVPGSRPGPFSKCQRLNKPCWLFDKAPKTVLEENYSCMTPDNSNPWILAGIIMPHFIKYCEIYCEFFLGK